MDGKSMGIKLKECRVKKGWSREKAAEKMDIGPRYLAHIECGRKEPKLETFVRILNTLEASADDVLQDSLAVGYGPRSNDLMKELEGLTPAQRQQALDIFKSTIETLKKH